MSSEASDLDAMIERMAREEQDDVDRDHGQHILDVTDYARRSQHQEDPLLKALDEAHQAKAEDDKE
jgi:hypothetical protein